MHHERPSKINHFQGIIQYRTERHKKSVNFFQNFLESKISPELKKDFFFRSMIYLGLYSVFIMPIIRANYFYIDDLGRSLFGYTSWGKAGRPFASFLMEAVNFHRTVITDLGPMPQILSVILLAMASAWISIFYRLRFGIGILPFTLIVCNPFFLENLSYRFDSLTMSVAVCLAMLPFGLTLLLSGIPLYGATFLAIFASLNFYQAAPNAFIVLTFFSALVDVRTLNIGDAVRRAFWRITCLVVALIVYAIETRFLHLDSYASAHAGLALDDRSLVFGNLAYVYRFLAINLFHTPQTELLLCAMLLGVLSFFVGLYRGNSRQKKSTVIISAATSVVFLLGMLGGIVGPTVLLRSPIWEPRVMIGFGALSACLLSFIVLESQNSEFSKYVSIMLCVILFAQFTICFAYGNALNAQGHLEEQIASNISEDAFTLSKGNTSFLAVNGIEPKAPTAQLASGSYPIVNTLLQLPLDGAWAWGGVLLRLHGLPSNVEFSNGAMSKTKINRILSQCKMDEMIARVHYNIYKIGPYLLVDFDKHCSGPKFNLS